MLNVLSKHMHANNDGDDEEEDEEDADKKEEERKLWEMMDVCMAWRMVKLQVHCLY